jgi:hypothetical protein
VSHTDERFTGVNHWEHAEELSSAGFRCGYCSTDVASSKGWHVPGVGAYIRICPRCNAPTFFDAHGGVWPGAKQGMPVGHLAEEVEALYEEARASASAKAYTGAVMLCRKILMHVAVEHGAKEALSFKAYVEWLVTEHYVPRGADGWPDYIRKRGNEANHEIRVMTADDADGVLVFTEMLLRSVYELPKLVPVLPPPPPSK